MAEGDNIPGTVATENPLTAIPGNPTPFQPFPGPSGQIGGQAFADIQEEFADKRRREEEAALLKEQVQRIVRVNIPIEVGHVTAPFNETYGAYKALHDFRRGGVHIFPIQFNPYQFLFDEKIARALDGEALNGPITNPDPKHPDFAKQESLRKNIAILRNILYVKYFGKDGYKSFDPVDQNNLAKITTMAEMLGNALAKGQNGKAPFFNSVSVDAASEPDKGVAVMYNYLCDVQRQPWHRPIVDFLKFFIPGESAYNWDLPPIEQTPLKAANMAMDALGIEAIENLNPNTTGEKMLNYGVYMDFARAQTVSPEQMQKPVQDRAIYLAMEILENFRIRSGENAQDANLARKEENELEQIERIYHASVIYKDKFAEIVMANPAFKANPLFLQANDALAKLTFLIKQQAFEELTKEGGGGQLMAEIMDRVPRDHRPKPNETFDVLVQRLQAGLEEAARAKGLDGPWMHASSQSVANEATQAKLKQDMTGHQDVTKALQDQRDKNLAGKMAQVDAGYKKLVNGALGPMQTGMTDAQIAAASDLEAVNRAKQAALYQQTIAQAKLQEEHAAAKGK